MVLERRYTRHCFQPYSFFLLLLFNACIIFITWCSLGTNSGGWHPCIIHQFKSALIAVFPNTARHTKSFIQSIRFYIIRKKSIGFCLFFFFFFVLFIHNYLPSISQTYRMISHTRKVQFIIVVVLYFLNGYYFIFNNRLNGSCSEYIYT